MVITSFNIATLDEVERDVEYIYVENADAEHIQTRNTPKGYINARIAKPDAR